MCFACVTDKRCSPPPHTHTHNIQLVFAAFRYTACVARRAAFLCYCCQRQQLATTTETETETEAEAEREAEAAAQRVPKRTATISTTRKQTVNMLNALPAALPH